MGATAVGKPYQLLIGGSWVDGANGVYEIINPATEAVVGEAPEASADDARSAAAAAREAFEGWSRTAPERRASLLRGVADRIRERQADMIPLIIAETGATLAVGSAMQVPVAADRFERYARSATEDHRVPISPVPMNATPLAPGALMGAVAMRQPVGVVACITPYNFPITNMAGKIAPALAMGNTVVIKPAPQDPLSVLELVRVMEEVGFPPGVVNVVTGSGAEAGAALVETIDVDMVSFTGSTEVGQRIYASGAPTMKRLLMELGGKGACIVFDDADVSKAVTALVSVFAFHSGQICTAPTRAIVHRSVYDHLVSTLAGAAGRLPVGDPTKKETIVGPVISAAQRDRIEGYVQLGRDEGAEVVAGGRRPAVDSGFYVAPTLLAGCTNDMRVAREEIFGPVVVIIPFDEEDEAVSLANDSDYGLYDYVYSSDSARAFRVARQLRCGHVGINTAQRNLEAPFGGFKRSGVGRDGGEFSLHAYSEVQSIIWPG